MPIYRAQKPDYLDDPATIRNLTDWSGTSDGYCKQAKKMGLPTDQCKADWELLWGRVWVKINADREFLLLWFASPELRALVPKDWTVVFENGPVTLLRTGAVAKPRLPQ